MKVERPVCLEKQFSVFLGAAVLHRFYCIQRCRVVGKTALSIYVLYYIHSYPKNIRSIQNNIYGRFKKKPWKHCSAKTENY